MAKSKYYALVEPRLRDVEQWANEGLSEEQISRNLGIASSTMDSYKVKHSDFAEILRRGKSHANAEVENALYKRALGYTVPVEKTFKLRKVEYDEATGRKISEHEELAVGVDEVHVPADVRAQEFWLTRRDGERWPIKQEVSEGVADGGGVIVLGEVAQP